MKCSIYSNIFYILFSCFASLLENIMNNVNFCRKVIKKVNNLSGEDKTEN